MWDAGTGPPVSCSSFLLDPPLCPLCQPQLPTGPSPVSSLPAPAPPLDPTLCPLYLPSPQHLPLAVPQDHSHRASITLAIGLSPWGANHFTLNSLRLDFLVLSFLTALGTRQAVFAFALLLNVCTEWGSSLAQEQVATSSARSEEDSWPFR